MLLFDIELKFFRLNYLGFYCCFWVKIVFISLICLFCLFCDEGYYFLESNQLSDFYFILLYIEIKVFNIRIILFINVRNFVFNRLFKSIWLLQLYFFKFLNGFLYLFIILKLDKKIRFFFFL